jgi:ribosome biogenesis GTPase A
MWYPGHIKKAKDSIKKNLKIVDAVIELLDARAPYASRAYEFEKLFKNKQKILIMNKYDICDKEKTEKWVKLYSEKGYVVLKTNLKSENIKKFLENKVAKHIPINYKEKRAIIVGVPNVGKSTFINRFKGKKSTTIGNTPGVTKGVQWISVNKEIKILDTPGILFPELYNEGIKNKLTAIGSIKGDDVIKDDAVFYIFDYLKENYPEYLENIVEKGSSKENAYEFILEFAKKRNFIKKGGVGDYDRGRNTFLKDFNDGIFGPVTLEAPEDYEQIKI